MKIETCCLYIIKVSRKIYSFLKIVIIFKSLRKRSVNKIFNKKLNNNKKENEIGSNIFVESVQKCGRFERLVGFKHLNQEAFVKIRELFGAAASICGLRFWLCVSCLYSSWSRIVRHFVHHSWQNTFPRIENYQFFLDYVFLAILCHFYRYFSTHTLFSQNKFCIKALLSKTQQINSGIISHCC